MYVQLQGWGKNISASAWTSATTTLTESQEGQRTLVPRCKLKKITNSSNPFRSFSLLASAALSPTPACVNAHECSQSTSNQSRKSSPFVSFTLLHSTFVYSSLSSPAFKIVFKFA